MIVIQIHVKMVVHVQMVLIHILVPVLLDIVEAIVKQISMIVIQIHVKMVVLVLMVLLIILVHVLLVLVVMIVKLI